MVKIHDLTDMTTPCLAVVSDLEVESRHLGHVTADSAAWDALKRIHFSSAMSEYDLKPTSGLNMA